VHIGKKLWGVARDAAGRRVAFPIRGFEVGARPDEYLRCLESSGVAGESQERPPSRAARVHVGSRFEKDAHELRVPRDAMAC
jgi:hypothetical protein